MFKSLNVSDTQFTDKVVNRLSNFSNQMQQYDKPTVVEYSNI